MRDGCEGRTDGVTEKGRYWLALSGAGLPAPEERAFLCGEAGVSPPTRSSSRDLGTERGGQPGGPTCAFVRPGRGSAKPAGLAGLRRPHVALRSPRCDGGAGDPGAGEWTVRQATPARTPPTWPRRAAVQDGGVL